MALETLANMSVRDGGAWVHPSGNDTGLSVFDTTWKTVKELYVRDSGAWHYVWPLRATTATLTDVVFGSCPSTNSYYKFTMHLIGPLPQVTVGIGDLFKWSYYRRQSFTSQAHMLTLSWTFIGFSPPITTTSFLSAAIGNTAPLGGPATNLWTQFQGRITHTVHGEQSEAQGGHVTTFPRTGKRIICAP